jgi:SAM-dependent methyltransferase
VARAEAAGLGDRTVDAVTIAQALHWFDHDRFWSEVRRVLRPGGIVAGFSYGMQWTGEAEIDAAVRHYHDVIVGPWWPPERALIGEGYLGLPFPFPRLEPPRFELTAEWTLAQFLGYVRSWSGTQRRIAATGEDPLPSLAERLDARWGARPRTVHWPLTVLAGRHAGG